MEYCALLRRIRAGTAIIDDYLAKTCTPSNGHQAYKVIVHSSQLQQHICEIAQSATVYLYGTYHCIDTSVKVDNWRSLAMLDHGSNSSRPSLFIFMKDMPIVINQNLYLIKEATVVDFALDESANTYSFGDNTVGEYFQTMVLCCPNASLAGTI